MGLDLLDKLSNSLTSKKVGIVEFSESDEYCGKPLFPRQQVLLKLFFLEEMEGWEEDVLTNWINNTSGEVSISPNIRARRDKLREMGYPHFREIMLVGGRRSSKGHMTGLSYAYKLWQQIALEDPQTFYGVDRDKQLYFTIIATSEDQAKKYQFADVKGAIRSCVAMQPYIARMMSTEVHVRTPKDIQRMNTSKLAHGNIEHPASLIVRASAANASSVRGEATMVLDMDEMAHMMEGVNTKSSAEEIFDAATPALDQFGKYALIFQNSSPYTKVGKFYENYCLGMNIGLDGAATQEDIDYRQLVFQFPSWELYRDWKRKYPVIKQPIASPPEESEPMRLEEAKNPEKFAVERRSHFAEVLEGFLNANMVDKCFQPFNGRMLRTKTSRVGFGPETTFKMHGDPATTDKNFGFVVGHMEYEEDEQERMVPHCVIDLVHAWMPAEQENHTVNFLDIQDEILEHIVNFRPDDVTFDQFQSNALIRWLQRESGKRGASGMNIREVTATEKLNLQRAEIAKTAINLGLVHIPHDTRFCELLRNEMKFLQKKGNRIIHQPAGPVQTKDICDCLFECVYYLLGSYLTQDMNQSITKGGLGGYNYLEQAQSFEKMWYGKDRSSNMNINRARNAKPIRGSGRKRGR
jgi:hypothetical protein